MDRFSPSSASDADANWIQSLPKAELPNVVNTVAKPQPQRPRPSPKSPPPPQERVGTPAFASQSATTPQANQQVLKEQRPLVEDELARATESHIVVTRRLEELSREKSRLENLHSGAQIKIGELETGRLELEQRFGEASRKVDSLQSGRSSFRVETELRRDVTTEIKRLASDLGSAQREVLSARDRSEKVESELSAARSQIEELRASAASDSKRWQEQDQSRQQTISLLVSEKASLIASVQRLEEVEIGIVATIHVVWTSFKPSSFRTAGEGNFVSCRADKGYEPGQQCPRIRNRYFEAKKRTRGDSCSGEGIAGTRSRPCTCSISLLGRKRWSHRPCRSARSNLGKLNSKKCKERQPNTSNESASWRSRSRVTTGQINLRSL